MKSKEEVLRRLAMCIRLKGQDHKTEQSYCRVAGLYYDFTLTCPRDWSSERKAEEYLSRRVTHDKISASSQNHDLAAINALYLACGKRLGNIDALRAKRPVYERHCPTTEELMHLLNTLTDTPQVPARLLAAIMAGCGFRVNEILELRFKDIRREGERVHAVIREPKHGHDRVVHIPAQLLPPMRRQAIYARHVFSLDQERSPRLPLQVPHALARKYPRSPHSLGWAFLFPSVQAMATPRTGEMVRWHLPDYAVQKAFSAACDKLEREGKIVARITPHCLRHWYATHFQGDIRDLQALLGHRSLETTQTYRHPQLERVTSPLETLVPQLALAS